MFKCTKNTYTHKNIHADKHTNTHAVGARPHTHTHTERSAVTLPSAFSAKGAPITSERVLPAGKSTGASATRPQGTRPRRSSSPVTCRSPGGRAFCRGMKDVRLRIAQINSFRERRRVRRCEGLQRPPSRHPFHRRTAQPPSGGRGVSRTGGRAPPAAKPSTCRVCAAAALFSHLQSCVSAESSLLIQWRENVSCSLV